MFREKYGNKYKAKSTIYQGIQYHSKKEAGIAEEFYLRKLANDIVSFERQVKIDLTAHGRHIANYYIDFVILHKDGTTEYVEVKGFETEVWRLKWKIFEAQYGNLPNVKLTVIK